MNPLVTIIMATYNRAHLIGETLVSIQNQTYPHWECLIVDDGSTDNTKEVVEQFCAKEPRFLYKLKDTVKYKKGLSGTRNCGLDWAQERNALYIQLFDDDDIMHPQKLELQLKPLLEKNDLSFSLCEYKHFEPNKDLNFSLFSFKEKFNLASSDLLKDFYNYKIYINSLGPLWNANILLSFRFDEELLYGEERDLYLKMFLNNNIEYAPVNYVLFYYRKHELSNTKNRYDNFVKYCAEQKIMHNWYQHAILNNQLNKFLLNKYLQFFIFKNRNLVYAKKKLQKHKNYFSTFDFLIKKISINFLSFFEKVLIKFF